MLWNAAVVPQLSLQRNYEAGPPSDWPNSYISSYAAMHPWEDWAETWAHYLHRQSSGAFPRFESYRHPSSASSSAPFGARLEGWPLAHLACGHPSRRAQERAPRDEVRCIWIPPIRTDWFLGIGLLDHASKHGLGRPLEWSA